MKVKINPLARECPVCYGSCKDPYDGERCNRCAGLGEINECECGEYLDPDKDHPAFLFFSDKMALRLCDECAEVARGDRVNYTEISDDGTPILPPPSTAIAWVDGIGSDVPVYKAWELPLGMTVMTFGGVVGKIVYDSRAAKPCVSYTDKYSVRKKRFLDKDELVAIVLADESE